MPYSGGYVTGAPTVQNRETAMAMADAYFSATHPGGSVQYFANQGSGHWSFIRADWLWHRGEWLTYYNYPTTSYAYYPGGPAYAPPAHGGGSGGGATPPSGGYTGTTPPQPAPPPPPPAVPISVPPVDIPPPSAPGYEAAPSLGASAERPVAAVSPRPGYGGDEPEYPSLAAGTRISAHPSLSGLAGAYLVAQPPEEMPVEEPPTYYRPPTITQPPYGAPTQPTEDHGTYAPGVSFIDPISGRPHGAGQTGAPEIPDPPVMWGELQQPTFLGSARPPGPDGTTAPPVLESPPAEIVSTCKCQLVVWEAGPWTPFSGIAEPAIARTQEMRDIPQRYRSAFLHLEESSPRFHRGRIVLRSTGAGGVGVSGVLSLLIYRNGLRVDDAIVFREIDRAGMPLTPAWSGSSSLVFNDVTCEKTVYFEFKPLFEAQANNLLDKNDFYEIRAEWPSDPMPSRAQRDARVFCSVEARILVPPCACHLRPLLKIGSVPGHVEAREFRLSVCIGAGAGPDNRDTDRPICSHPETTAVRLEKNGRPGERQFSITSRFQDGEDEPLEFLLLDSLAARDGTREIGEPDPGTGKWIERDLKRRWARSIGNPTFPEPCRTVPQRIMVRLRTDNSEEATRSRRSIGAALYKRIKTLAEENAPRYRSSVGTPGMSEQQIDARAFKAAVAEAWRSASVDTYIQYFGGAERGNLLCEVKLPIRVRGGIWVWSDQREFHRNVLWALRELCGRIRTSTEDFDWIDGREPGVNEVGLIVPTESFCSGRDDPSIGHPVGRRLVKQFLCGTCCAVIQSGATNDAYNPWNPRDTFPKGSFPRNNIQHFSHPPRDCGGLRVIRHASDLSTYNNASGIGTGGVVELQATSVQPVTIDPNTGERISSVNWSQWMPDMATGRWVKDQRLRVTSPARIIAHELGHVAEGCVGDTFVGARYAPSELDGFYQLGVEAVSKTA